MPPSPFWIQIEDWHTAGEPFRIVEKLPDGSLPESSTVAQRRLDIIADPRHALDQLRQSLCHEPKEADRRAALRSFDGCNSEFYNGL